MNGFERSSGQEADALEPLFPDDYSPDEMDFAHEVRALFPIEDEVLPPYFVQTMMDDTFTAPVTPSDERTLVSGVFARLRVAREPLLAKLPVLPSWPSLVETIAQLSTFSRSVVTAASMALAAMLFSVVLTGPAFAAGLQILLGHTGVQQIQSYPSSVQHVSSRAQPGTSQPSTPLYWFGPTIGNYGYTGRRTLHEDWAQDPIVELQYQLLSPAQGSGVLDLRMFRVSSAYAAVLQVVHTGSAHEASLGDTSAVYVNGAWLLTGQRGVWQQGERSMLIFERDSIVFWLVGDPRDGLGQEQLVAVAKQLHPATAHDLAQNRSMLRLLGSELSMALKKPLGDELYALVPAGDSAAGESPTGVQLQAMGPYVGTG